MKNRIALLCKAILPEWSIPLLQKTLYRSVKALYTPEYAARRWLSRNKVAGKIRKLDQFPVPAIPQELRAFLVVRNEALRLSFILKYYFSRGVDRIFVLDNGSSDDTAAIAASNRNTHLFFTSDDYVNQGYWIDFLLHRYGIGHWCIIVDADEMLTYPYYETLSLKKLCAFLDQESFNAMHSILLDMYPGISLDKIRYEKGTDPLLVAPWFDTGPYTTRRRPLYFPSWNILQQGSECIFGGVRKRIFDINPMLSKFPLVKFRKSIFLTPGTHLIQGARIADIRGALLHFKYLDDFPENVKREATGAKRHTNVMWSAENRSYLKKLECAANLNFWSPLSQKFANSKQLVDLGIMKSSDGLEAFKKVICGSDAGELDCVLPGI